MTPQHDLEEYFAPFRNATIGRRQCFESPFGRKEIIYADWTASGRAYGPIEECLRERVLPFVGNTHTETTVTGGLMSMAYEEAKLIIKRHVGADDNDVLLFCGSGMTAAVNKLQRIMGMRVPERLGEYMKDARSVDEASRPVVFVTEMEHHSNHVSWLETIATVEIIPCEEGGGPDLLYFGKLLERYKDRRNKIAAVTACSNVTGIETPYHDIARMIHGYGGLCFVDFACSAPYVEMDMHPPRDGAHIDAIYFSPHKFLGGPGTPGVLIFNKKLYSNRIPDQPGGGTVMYTNPWKVQEYVADIELREDGGTPPFLQAIKAGMCIRLKEEMGVERMWMREEELIEFIFRRFGQIRGVKVLEAGVTGRLGIFAFVVPGAHYALIVRLLNDRFGVQLRGGCSCAGTYGHRLLGVGPVASYAILDRIREGDLLCKPGWVRLSVHPTMKEEEIEFIMDAIEAVAANVSEWEKDYMYDARRNEYDFVGRGRTVEMGGMNRTVRTGGIPGMNGAMRMTGTESGEAGRKERERVEGWFRVGEW